MDNIRKWETFLRPLKKRTIKRVKDEYDTKTMDSKPSMSRDIALQLEQEITVNEEELHAYSQSQGDLEVQRQHIRKNLFSGSGGAVKSISSSIRPSSPSGESPYIDDSDDDDDDFSDAGEEPVSEKHKSDANSVHNVLQHVPLDCKRRRITPEEEEKSEYVNKPLSGEIVKEEIQAHEEKSLRKVNTFPPGINSPRPLTHPPHGTPRHSGQSPLRPQLTMSSSQLPIGYQGTVHSAAPKERPMVRPTKIVDHRSTSLSKWTFPMFTNYVDFEKYVRELTITAQNNDDVKPLIAHFNTLYDDVLAMFGARSLKDCMFRESNIRVLLDGLLLKLCKLHNIHLQTEEQSKLRYLPTGKLNNLFSTEDGRPLGCLEAKSPSSMDKKAFAQAVLELNLVQQIAHKKGVDIESTPLFCILSDGYRFVLMQLKGRELLLEHKRDISKTQQRTLSFDRYQYESPTRGASINIRKLDKEDDFSVLVTAMSNLIKMSKLHAEKSVAKKECNLLDFFQG